MKTLSRKPFLLMLSDDSGELAPVRLDVGLVNADHALIVLDEYNDTCWLWIGRHVSMPTRMHATRMARSIQKSGFKIGVTTIGLASGKLIEMMEKDDTDPEVASAIMSFKTILDYKWSFDDKFLAFKKDVATSSTEPIAGAPTKRREPEPEPVLTARTIRDEPAGQKYTPPKAKPTPPLTSEPTVTLADKKAGYLMMATIKNSDIVYTEKIERSGTPGMKIEVPGIMVIEVLLKENEISITPGDFGGSEGALKIKSDFTKMVNTL
ncbi:MAG: hypothetical protein OEV85_10125 [Candidatus Thorarchaeota archaeon]|nr:hypothetical protein [Candidatus Thorarchaeota archaeon]